jgi:hypothetical protein
MVRTAEAELLELRRERVVAEEWAVAVSLGWWRLLILL